MTEIGSSGSLAPGVTLGRSRLIDRIGAGGMGEVWQAHDANLDRTVAIKLLLPGALAARIAGRIAKAAIEQLKKK
jgi:serine/threonine-protein kinase